MAESVREIKRRWGIEFNLPLLRLWVLLQPVPFRELPARVASRTNPDWVFEAMTITGASLGIIGLLRLIRTPHQKFTSILVFSLACLVLAEAGSRALQFGWVDRSVTIVPWLLGLASFWGVVLFLDRSMQLVNRPLVRKQCRRWFWLCGTAALWMVLAFLASMTGDLSLARDFGLIATLTTLATLVFLWFLLRQGIRSAGPAETIERVFD